MALLNHKVQYLDEYSIIGLHTDMVMLLNALAYYCDGLFINCGYRSRKSDIAKGRSGNSAHCKGLAVDIRCLDNRERYELLSSIESLRIAHPEFFKGVYRLGIAKTFIHLDIDTSLPNNRVWLYE